jgi:DNA invertase Pin-like site-specific DNA recombinase
VDHPSFPVAHVSGKTIASFTNHFWCAAGVEREQCGHPNRRQTRSAGKGLPFTPLPSGLASKSPRVIGITTPRSVVPIRSRAREGFAGLLDRIEGNGVRTVIVEDANRFAREPVVQELGIALLAKRGVRLLTTSGDDLTDSDDLGRKMMRQVAGAFMEYEKGRLVAKLRGARERKRKETGKKVGGRKSHAELWPEVVPEARRLRKAKGKACRLSYREISARLKEAGYSNERGQPFNPQSVRAMLEGPQRRQRRAEARINKFGARVAHVRPVRTCRITSWD